MSCDLVLGQMTGATSGVKPDRTVMMQYLKHDALKRYHYHSVFSDPEVFLPLTLSRITPTCGTRQLQPLFRELSINQEFPIHYFLQNYIQSHQFINPARCLQVCLPLQICMTTVY